MIDNLDSIVAKIMSERAIKDGIGFTSAISFIPHKPTPRQEVFLDLDDKREVFYGGAAGGGKSDALLMAALEYVHVPGYAALLLRKTYVDLARPGALMDRARKWLGPTAAVWKEKDKQWVFPSGATLTFGYLEVENDKYKYQSSEFQFIGFDELTHFSETQYRYLFSRLRRLKDVEIPIRMRGGSNPGGYGGLWVKERFIPQDFTTEDAAFDRVWEKQGIDDETGETITRYFVPARLDDNPHLDQAEYELTLRELDPVTRAQLRRGDWAITAQGDILYMWDENQVIIPWSRFNKILKPNEKNPSNDVPVHWLLGVFQDWGTTEIHPCVTGWFATAAENAPTIDGVNLAGAKFMYRSMLRTRRTANQVKIDIYNHMQPMNEIPRTHIWQMSHEASSERMEYQRSSLDAPYSLPFINWETGKRRGIEQLKNAISPRELTKPHPFNPGVMGHPNLYIIVDDEELHNPRTDRGMVRIRQEAPSYRWDQPKSGEPARELTPYPLFNDAMDVLRGAAAVYFPRMEELTVAEAVKKVIQERVNFQIGANLTEGQQLTLARESARAMKEMRLNSDLSPQDQGLPDYNQW